MSNTGFTFPPPPPPPPKKDAMPGDDFGYGRGNGGGSFNRGSGRGGGSRARSRGFGGGAPRGNPFQNQRGGRGHPSSGPVSSNSGFVGHRGWSQGHSNRGNPPNGSMSSNYGAQQSQFQPGPRPTSSSGINHWNAPQKRDHATAFNHRGRGGSKPPAAPAVPSFLANIPGLSPPMPSIALPVVPNSPAEKKPKPRTSNILGLNPSIEEPESDDDDEDEEANLATNTTTPGVAFEYNGQAATLKTPAEIAAWIADRKKRFPTAAKAAQAKKVAQEQQKKWEEDKKANQEARRLQRESYEQEKAAKLQEVAKEKTVAGWLNATEMVKGPSEGINKGTDAAEKARLKTEKLIKKAAKAQKKLTKAQDALRKAQGAAAQSASTQSKAEGSNDPVVENVLTGEEAVKIATENQLKTSTSTLEDSDTSSVLNSMDSEDEDTSSSGSSSDPSSDSDSDAAPEVLTTKRTAPDRVAPLPRVAANTASTATHLIPCRNMMKYGKCNAGKKCRFSHDPDHAVDIVMHTRSGKQRDSQLNGRPKRKGLWEVMVEKEKEEEARAMLRVIVGMGEKGMLGAGGGN